MGFCNQESGLSESTTDLHAKEGDEISFSHVQPVTHEKY
jgi:hypothetical protein